MLHYIRLSHDFEEAVRVHELAGRFSDERHVGHWKILGVYGVCAKHSTVLEVLVFWLSTGISGETTAHEKHESMSEFVRVRCG